MSQKPESFDKFIEKIVGKSQPRPQQPQESFDQFKDRVIGKNVSDLPNS